MIKNIVAGGVLIGFLAFLFYPKGEAETVQTERVAEANTKVAPSKKARPTALAPTNNQPQNEFVFGQPMSDGSPVSLDEGTSKSDMIIDDVPAPAKAQASRKVPVSQNRPTASARPTAPRTKKDGQPTVLTAPVQKPVSNNPPRTIGGVKMEYANGSYSPVDGQVGSKSNPIGSGATN